MKNIYGTLIAIIMAIMSLSMTAANVTFTINVDDGSRVSALGTMFNTISFNTGDNEITSSTTSIFGQATYTLRGNDGCFLKS